MKLALFDYKLPKNLIAQKQIKPRDASRLMVINKKTKKINHDFFYNLDKYLTDNDVLVFNNSKVIPARIHLCKETGGKVEILLLRELNRGKWEVMIGGKLGDNFKFSILNFKSIPNFKCQILKRLPDGNWIIRFNISGEKLRKFIEKYGQTPLPPYIKIQDSKQIRKDYQTLYAKHEGSVAAPTAGFHFTQRVFNKLKKKGVKCEFVTLHVGLGTFQPVKVENIKKHKMHAEYVVLDKDVTRRLNDYKQQGKRIITVGTTAARVLEALSNQKSQLKAGSRWTRPQRLSKLKACDGGQVNIFIYPGYKFKFIDALITNFHLPKSTLLMLVSALVGRKFILKAYQEAIKRKYRFYSFGDGMLIK